MKKKWAIIGASLVFIVLAASTAFAATTMGKGKHVDVQGTIQELETDEVLIPTIYLHGNGSGNATGLGAFTTHFEGIVYNDAAGVGIGVEGVNFALASGEVIFAAATGVGRPTSTAGVNKIVEAYTVTGGTGRYVDARGSLTVERLVTLSTGASSGNIKGSLDLRKP